MSELKIQSTYLGPYPRTSQVEVINPLTEEITTVTKTITKFLYSLAFLSEEDKQAFISSNEENGYTPLQEDGSVLHRSNKKFEGASNKGDDTIITAVLTKSGKYVIPTSSVEELELRALQQQTLDNAQDPVHKAQVAKALATEEVEVLKDLRLQLQEQKQARLARAKKENASLTFSTQFSSAKADKKLDVK